jgi:voltage-gated potassium channel
MTPTEEEEIKEVLDHERSELLQQFDDWLEVPMLVLGFVWLALLVIEFIWGIGPVLNAIGLAIWVIFIIDFVIKFTLAPNKVAYFRRNWLTVIALIVPALRVFRIVYMVRLLRLARATRSIRLVRVVTSTNRGMRALRAAMGRRGVGYVISLTFLVILAGSAGMFAFESDVPGGLTSFGVALWWTIMIMTTLGSDYWPQTPEGRTLTVLLAIYALAVFGYLTAFLATFFIGRDAEDAESEVVGVKDIMALREEIAALRAEIRTLRSDQDSNHSW